MITYKAITEDFEKVFKSTRKADIKKWAKEQIKNGAECVDIYAYYKSPCPDTLGQPDYSFVGSIFSNGETSFK